MRLVLTGTPGTGKTKVATWISKTQGIPLVSLTSFIRSKKLHRKHEVDPTALQKALLSLLRTKQQWMVEGHLACEIHLPADYVIVLRCHPKVLRTRLMRRRYGKKKLQENLLAEMLDYATQRSQRNYRVPILELETAGRTVLQTGREILQAIRLKKKKLKEISYQDELLHELKLK